MHTDTSRDWIGGPWFDLVYFAWGWTVPLGLLFGGLALAPAHEVRTWFLLTVLAVNFVHRHLTWPLVYAEPAQLKQRPLGYTLVPLLCLMITALAVAWAAEGGFIALVGASVAWTLYHSLMQKVGLLRIYARKGGTGSPGLDRGLVFAWFAAVACLMAAHPEALREAGRVSLVAARLVHVVDGYRMPLMVAAAVSTVLACGVTALWLRQEWTAPRRNLPKLAYAGSIVALYALFPWDLVLAYAIFGLSHALEYIAFVAVYVRSKYEREPNLQSPLARAARMRRRSLLAFFVTTLLAFVALRESQIVLRGWHLFDWYLAGSSFIHFIYDGWLWKVRRPEVARTLSAG